MAMTKEQRRKMFGIAGELIKSGRSGGRAAGRSSQIMQLALDTGLLGEKASDMLRAASVGTMGYRWAAEQGAANLSFGMRIASARDPLTIIRLQGECLQDAWQRWGGYVTGLARVSLASGGRSA